MARLLPLLVAVSLVMALGCRNHDADCLARVAQRAAAKGEALASDVSPLQALHANLDEWTLDARVAARLRWDKSLEGAQIRVTITGDVVELKGAVNNEDQRKRAVALAESTTGVGQVSEFLEIQTP
jgi:osmotically-inducible protein OsmY